MFTSIAGRAVVVTGGTRGIGKGIASVFARNGARVLITGRDSDVARAAAEELSADGAEVSFIQADVSSREDCRRMAANAIERLGGGTVWSVQACLPALVRSGRGRVILTSSITGPITGYPGWTGYGASKAGQLGFMRTAAIELAPSGITVNAVLPGNIVTEGLAELGEDYATSMAASIPLRRLGSVDDIGYAALFLATDEAGYITGQTIVVDGGQVLPETLEAVLEAKAAG
jgi:3-oxoacyl-[acyl-carrier protein] reductase